MFDINKILSNNRNSKKIISNFHLKSYGGKNDRDGNGVPNKRDCQPYNTMRQDPIPMNYINDSRQLVLKSLNDLPNGWHTAPEIQRYGKQNYSDIMPITDTGYIEVMGRRRPTGGWGIFDFPDRTKRALDHSAKIGIIKHKKEGNINYYSKKEY